MWFGILGVVLLIAAVLCIRHVLKQVKPYDGQKHADSRYERDLGDTQDPNDNEDLKF